MSRAAAAELYEPGRPGPDFSPSRPRAAPIVSIPMRPPTNVQTANVERWSAEDDAWRGYRREGSRLLLEDRIEATLGLMLPARGGTMLDIGCATGVVSELLAKAAGVGRVEGVDFAAVPAAIETRAANLDSSEPLPYADASFDVVTCLETLEHVHDTDHLVREVHRLLKPGGYAVLSVPRIDGLLTVAMLALGMQPPAIECSLRQRYGSPEAGGRVSGHVSHFTRRAFEQLLVANAFRVEAFAQASIYSGWRLAAGPSASAWRRVPLWMLSRVPFKQDVQIVRVRAAVAGDRPCLARSVWSGPTRVSKTSGKAR
jgi:SAM-dependent methyltransferase